jgi:protein O-mannosyl-transferase
MEFAKTQAMKISANPKGGRGRDALGRNALGRDVLVCVALIVATLLVYFQTFHFAFVSHDDQIYVYDNPHVLTGLTLANVKWSWTHFYDTNWIPFTFMSLMADASLYGVHAGGFHLTNALLHAANALLLYLALAAATGARAKSAVVAALFALHPLHVESVAWIAERKDVLSTFFGFLSLFYYVRYATRGRLWRLGVSALFFVGSLLAKQTFVTLPFLLLLLDYWPLGRLGVGTAGSQSASAGERAAQDRANQDIVNRDIVNRDSVSRDRMSRDRAADSKGVATVESAQSHMRLSLSRLILEKLPFFVLSAGFSAIALAAQRDSEVSLNLLPFAWRLKNAIYVYVAYLEKALFPHNLAMYYPLSRDSLTWTVVGLSAALLLAITAVAVACYRRFPFLPVGWFWYLGTLVPMIGLVQIGWQQMADRYTYLPLVGIFIAVTWLVPELIPPGALRSRLLPAAVAACIAVLATATYSQVALWHDGVTLMRHSKECTPDNPPAHDFLGEALLYDGKLEEGAKELENCARMAPHYLPVRLELGNTYRRLGRHEQSIARYKEALAIDQKSAEAHRGLGLTYCARDQNEDAEYHYLKALEIDPQCAAAFVNLAALAYGKYDNKSAIDYSERALQISPDLLAPQICIAVALRQEGHFDEAIKRLEQLVAQMPSEPQTQQILARTREMKQNAARQ